MIRKFQIEDLDRVMEIWLNGNCEAHDFVDRSYWEENFENVKEMLPQAELYIYEDAKGIQGFAGIMENYIAGIFVCSASRSKGIGKCLLDAAKAKKENLSLHVYQKNERAVRFYLREGFAVQSEGMDEDTGEKDFLMVWDSEL